MRVAPDIEALRAAVDVLDDRLLSLVSDRSRMVARIQALKARWGLSPRDPAREDAVLVRARAHGVGRYSREVGVAVLRLLIEAAEDVVAPPGRPTRGRGAIAGGPPPPAGRAADRQNGHGPHPRRGSWPRGRGFER